MAKNSLAEEEFFKWCLLRNIVPIVPIKFSHNYDFPSLKYSSPGQFLASSN